MASLKDSRKAMITIGLDPRPLEKGIEEARAKLWGLGNLKKIMIGGAATAVGNMISGGLGKIGGPGLRAQPDATADRGRAHCWRDVRAAREHREGVARHVGRA